jgi:hypothetical protein
MPRQAIIDQREITRDGTLQIRIAKQVLDNGDVVAESWHRTSLALGQDLEALIVAVDADLVRQGFGAVQDWSSVRRTVLMEHTPEAVAAFVASQA